MAIDSYTKLLLHCNGADGSTTFIDSATGKTVTAVGNAQIDTAQSKFGGASALFDGNDDYLTIPDSADWDMGTGAFTVDYWIRFVSLATGAGRDCMVDVGGVTLGFFIRYWGDQGLEISGSDAAGILTPWTPSLNTWIHVAVVRTGNSLMAFIDGTQIGSTFDCTAWNINQSAGVYIGSSIGNPTTEEVDGWMDEIRISKGIARWTANFTPPNRAYNGAGGGLGIGNPYIF